MIWPSECVFFGQDLHGIEWPFDITFSPDGAWLATASSARVAELWDARSGKLRAASPESANLWTNLGVAHYRIGDWEATIAAMERAGTLTDDVRHPLRGEQLLFLAMAHWQLGSHEKSRELYQMAAEWISQNQPNDEELDGYLLEATELLTTHDEP